MVVLDVSRPDTNGTPPRMAEVARIIDEKLSDLPFIRVRTDDNLCSSIVIRGALNPSEEWNNGLFENGQSFSIMIFTEKRKRYYEDGDKVSAEISWNRLGKFRKYTSSPEKVAQRIREWVELQREQQNNSLDNESS